MADAAKDAREELGAAVAAASAAARSNPLWAEDASDLEERAEAAGADGGSVSGWKNPYPHNDPRSLLLEYQFAYYHDRSRFKFGLQGRQTGKDFTSQGEAVDDCLARPGTEWMVAAPSERQALDSLEQGKTWAAAFGMMVEDEEISRDGVEAVLKSAEITIRMPGSQKPSRIRAVPGKPDTVRGRSANILLTEFDFFENPAATWRALLPSITNPLRGGEKKVRLVTTPNGTGGAAHRIWTKKDTETMAWSRHLVTLYHAVLMGLPVDVRQIREALDDADGFAQEFLCRFLDGSNVLLPYDLMAAAESYDATEAWDPASEAGTEHPVYVGIDFGRTNDPTVAWTLQRVGDVLWTREVLVLQTVATPEQEAILRSRVERARLVCFDYTGPGIGLGDYLVKEHGQYKPDGHAFGKVELCTFTAGFKRQIFPRLRRAFEPPVGLRVPVSTVIREDLHEMRQEITNGEYNYWSPRTKKGHSDRCTGLALAVRAAQEGASGPFHYMPVRMPGRGSRRNYAGRVTL